MPRHLATHYISALAEEPDGTVWAGSAGEGLFQFKSGKLVAINASSGLSDNLVETLLMDREGKLWVGTHGGLNRISPRNLSVLSHNEGLGYGSVQGLTEVQPGIIWATVPNEGVYCWDGQKFRRLILDGLSWQQNPRVSALLLTRDGSCWVVGAGGLFQFKNPKAAEAEGGLPVLTNLSISALGQDFKGGVWAGTREGELWHLSNGKWQAQTNCPRGHAITAIMPDVDGALWIGTEGDGLYRFDERASVQCEKVSGIPVVGFAHCAWILNGRFGLAPPVAVQAGCKTGTLPLSPCAKDCRTIRFPRSSKMMTATCGWAATGESPG